MNSDNHCINSCGLDFGTSNSTLGLVGEDGTPYRVQLEGANLQLPSVLFFNFENDQTYFGQAALLEYVNGADGRMMRALKSVLGTSLMKEETRIKGNRVSFVKVLEIFLSRIKRKIPDQNFGVISQVVAGRPVRFSDDDDAADREAQNQLAAAIRGVGFDHVEFQYEPIAAALDYERTIQIEQLALVVDIGGGTSDFSIIRLSPERARHVDRSKDILATGGVHVGGTDFDRLFSMAEIMPLLGLNSFVKDGSRQIPIGPYFDLSSWHRINRLYTHTMLKNLRQTRQEAACRPELEKLLGIVEGRYGHLLASHLEACKIALTHSLQEKLHFVAGDIVLEKHLSRAQLDLSIVETVMRIPATIEEVLRMARVNASDVQTLIMTGGSTQIPVLRQQLDNQFPAAEFVQTDAFGSVGLGLALDASRRF